MALTFSISSQAAASRTFISTAGSDTNTSVNCSPAANCRTFGAALSVTTSGGEIVVLNSGGYGPATISQPVIITAVGVDASISVTTAGGNGITINTPGNVTLTGLNLHGEGTGANGVLVQQVGALRLYNVLIENFTNDGVNFAVSGKLGVYQSVINDNAGAGVLISNASASAIVNSTNFDNDGNAVEVTAGQATVSNSGASHSTNTTAFLANGGSLSLFNDRAAANNTAFGASGGGAVYFSNCILANNTNSFDVGAGGTISGTNPGTTLVGPSQTQTGSLTPIALQ